MIISEKRIKRQAELIENKFNLNHSESLEFVAKLNCFKNWDHYTKELKKDNGLQLQGFSLSSVYFTKQTIRFLWHTSTDSFLTKQLDRFDLTLSELTLKTILELDDDKNCKFYFTDDFLKAKILSDYFDAQGEQTAIFYDSASDEKQYDTFAIWVTVPFPFD